MKYTVDEKDSRPLYLQLYYQIREDISNGTLRAGEKLLSKRTLAEECGVSVITAEHVYSLLSDEGYIVSKEKSGYYVAAESSTIPYRSDSPERPYHTKQTAHINTEFPLSSLKKHMRSVIAEAGDALIGRAPNNGCLELREAISGYLERFRGLTVTPEQIVIGSGAEYLYSLLIQLFGRNALFGIEDPCYKKIEQVYDANEVKYEKLPLAEDGIRSDVLNGTAANVLHITPYHSFPSGVTASPRKRAEYIAWARAHGSYIIEDDYASEFSTLSKPFDTIYSLDPNGAVIYINTFSKTLAPSMRIGYMGIPEGLMQKYAERLGFYSCTVPVFDQLVLASFIDSGEFERHINKMRRHLRAELKG